MNDKLKPCPFCGGEVKSKIYGFGVVGVIACTGCRTMFVIPWEEAESGKELFKAWNNRASGKEKDEE